MYRVTPWKESGVCREPGTGMPTRRGGGSLRTQSRCKLGVVFRVRRDEAAHDAEQAFRVIVDLDIDIEQDVLVLRPHEQVERLLQGRDFLMRRFARPELVNFAVVLLVVDRAGAVGSSVCSHGRSYLALDAKIQVRRVFLTAKLTQQRVVEHDNHVVGSNVDICVRAQDGMVRRFVRSGSLGCFPAPCFGNVWLASPRGGGRVVGEPWEVQLLAPERALEFPTVLAPPPLAARIHRHVHRGRAYAPLARGTALDASQSI